MADLVMGMVDIVSDWSAHNYTGYLKDLTKYAEKFYNGFVIFMDQNIEVQADEDLRPGFPWGTGQSFKRKFISGYKLVLLAVVIFGLICAGIIGLAVGKNKSTEIRSKATGPQQFVFSSGGIQISPVKAVYLPGEQVTITIVIATVGAGKLQDIKARWAPSRRNIIQVPYISTDIAGTYNSTTKTWTGSWILPGNGEYVVMANLIQTNEQMCAGNPAYTCTGCRAGTMTGLLNGAQITPGIYPCTGYHKPIVVDSNYGNTTGYNMKQYWNLSSGYYWVYTGENKKCGLRASYPYPAPMPTCAPGAGAFTTRVAVEEKVNVCGHQLLPERFTKSKPEGYIVANVDNNFRKFISYFQSGEKWSSSTIGRPMAKFYTWTNSTSQLANLGAVVATGGSRSLSSDTMIDFEDIYYAPHFFHNQFIPLGWQYEGIDKLYQDNMAVINSCNWPYKSFISEGVWERWIHNKLFEDNIQSTAYSGPVLRLRLFEAGYPIGSSWHIREDWYFAKDIGRVRVDWKDCRASLRVNPNDPDCSVTSTVKMANPDTSMSLSNYYIGGSLVTSVTPSSITGTGSWTLNVTTAQGKPYTGYLEAKNCISETSCTPGSPFKWGYGDGTYFWIENGTQTVNMPSVTIHTSGLRHAWFRPWVEKPPADAVGETVVTSTQLPWSNETTWRVTY